MKAVAKPKHVLYRNRIEALMRITDPLEFDRKQHARTRPEWKRARRKAARASRKRNRP
jgi:hypothetical protein